MALTFVLHGNGRGRPRPLAGVRVVDFPWGAGWVLDEILGETHLQDRRFFVEVERPELGRSLIYHGAAAIYNGSPWRISRRAPLIGEHNQGVLCGELGLSQQELTALAESGVVYCLHSGGTAGVLILMGLVSICVKQSDGFMRPEWGSWCLLGSLW